MHRTAAVGIVLVGPLLLSCGDEAATGPAEPAGGNGATGSLEVTLEITGTPADRDGCRVTVDDGSTRILHDGDSVIFGHLHAGDHIVTISEVDANCAVDGESSRSLTVQRNRKSRTEFNVTCRTPVRDHIAFVSDRGGDFDIWLMADDGSNSVNLTKNPASDRYPAWSPDGTRIAFASDRESTFSIYVMDGDGENVARLTSADMGSSDVWPSWSPHGDRIAFQRCGGTSCRIWVMDADGSNVAPLFEHPTAQQLEPAWSPDGMWIAYSSDRDGAYDIFKVGSAGGSPIKIASGPWDLTEPAWSPDGLQLAVYGFSRIEVMNADGTNRDFYVPCVRGGHASWSPDGTLIAYYSTCDIAQPHDIYAVEAGVGYVVNLTNSASDDIEPAWSPVQ